MRAMLLLGGGQIRNAVVDRKLLRHNQHRTTSTVGVNLTVLAATDLVNLLLYFFGGFSPTTIGATAAAAAAVEEQQQFGGGGVVVGGAGILFERRHGGGGGSGETAAAVVVHQRRPHSMNAKTKRRRSTKTASSKKELDRFDTNLGRFSTGPSNGAASGTGTVFVHYLKYCQISELLDFFSFM